MSDLVWFLSGALVATAVIQTRAALRRPKPRRRK
jgi:hypothetical protein